MPVLVHADQLDHALLELRGRAQARHQVRGQRDPSRVAARLPHGRSVAIRVSVDGLGRQVARLAHAVSVALPERLQVGGAFLFFFRRHVASYEGLRGALEFPGPYQVHVNGKFVDCILEEHAIAVVPCQQHEP